MTRIDLTEAFLEDLDRIADFLRTREPELVERAVGAIRAAILVLGDSPEVGRLVSAGLRELVISRGKTGYVALYVFDPLEDRVIVLRLRHQREAPFIP